MARLVTEILRCTPLTAQQLDHLLDIFCMVGDSMPTEQELWTARDELRAVYATDREIYGTSNNMVRVRCRWTMCRY
jgi:hypothetical protein